MDQIISVIIPAYNRESYIEECIGSVQGQSLQNFEILVVDDGSTDKTVEICTRLAQSDPRIHLLTSPHAGVSAARNQALDAAKGDYLFFLDSDDIIHPALLEGLLSKMTAHQVPMAFAGGCDVEDESWENRILTEILQVSDFNDYEYVPNAQLLQRFFKRTAILGRMGGIMIAKDHIGALRFRENLQIGEDVCFIYENIIRGCDAVILRQKGYFWRVHQSKTSYGISYSSFLSRLRCKEFLWQQETNFGRTENVNKEKAGVFMNYMISQAKNPIYSADNKKMRKTMKLYRKQLRPALTKQKRFLFFLSLYTPGLFRIIYKCIASRKKKQKNNQSV